MKSRKHQFELAGPGAYLKLRVRSKSGCARRGRAVPVTFNQPEQFELRLRIETNTES